MLTTSLVTALVDKGKDEGEGLCRNDHCRHTIFSSAFNESHRNEFHRDEDRDVVQGFHENSHRMRKTLSSKLMTRTATVVKMTESQKALIRGARDFSLALNRSRTEEVEIVGLHESPRRRREWICSNSLTTMEKKFKAGNIIESAAEERTLSADAYICSTLVARFQMFICSYLVTWRYLASERTRTRTNGSSLRA